MQQLNSLLVSVAMLTYNHEKYIYQAIESALSQSTNFEFEIVIGEDFSIDSTRNICKEFKKKYPEKIILLENTTNLGLVKNYQKVFNACKGKYVAILEGDDFWHDKYKLQKQIDILEKDDTIGFVYTNFNKLLETGRVIKNISKKNDELINGKELFEQIFYGNFICAGTVMFRKDIYDQYVNLDEYIKLNVPTIDAFLWIEIIKKCKVAYISSSTLTYRILETSLSNSKNYSQNIDFIKKNYNALLYFLDKHKPTHATKHAISLRTYRKLVFLSIKHNRREDALLFLQEYSKLNSTIKRFSFLWNNKICFFIISKLVRIKY
jgi:glycosyltransferase involved in cell wall biosynthesis